MTNNLMRFDPLTDMFRLDPFRNAEDFFRDFQMLPGLQARALESAQSMPMDVSETDRNYLIKANIPGVKKEDIKIAINGRQVNVSAEINTEKEVNESGILRRERYSGKQFRSFALPQEVDEENAQAKYENGVLQLTLPKKEGTSGKQISIQ